MRHDKQTRRGFSLLEITLVIVIMGVLAATAAVVGRGAVAKSKVKATKVTMQKIKEAIDSYQLDENAYPATLNDLITLDLITKDTDAWQRPLYYITPGVDGTRPFDLISLGADGKARTNDDINIWTLEL